jgi:hypothetical protein
MSTLTAAHQHYLGALKTCIPTTFKPTNHDFAGGGKPGNGIF